MKLKEWVNRCSVGDTCIVNGAEIKCQADPPDHPGDTCGDCVFMARSCDDIPCGECENEQRGNVFFSVEEGSRFDVDPDAELESCTLHPCSPEPDSGAYEDTASDDRANDSPGTVDDKTAWQLCSEFAARLGVVEAILNMQSIWSLVCVGMPDDELAQAEKELNIASEKIADLRRRVDAFRFKDERSEQ